MVLRMFFEASFLLWGLPGSPGVSWGVLGCHGVSWGVHVLHGAPARAGTLRANYLPFTWSNPKVGMIYVHGGQDSHSILKNAP